MELTGIDLGIKDLVITSHGQKYGNNKYLKQKLRQLKKSTKSSFQTKFEKTDNTGY